MKTLALLFLPRYQNRLFFGNNTPTIIPIMASHEMMIAKFAMVIIVLQVFRTGTEVQSDWPCKRPVQCLKNGKWRHACFAFLCWL